MLAWTLRPTLQPHVMEYVADESIAYFASLLGLFVVALIVFTVLAGVIGRLVRKGAKARLVLSVDLIGQAVSVEVDAADVKAY